MDENEEDKGQEGEKIHGENTLSDTKVIKLQEVDPLVSSEELQKHPSHNESHILNSNRINNDPTSSNKVGLTQQQDQRNSPPNINLATNEPNKGRKSKKQQMKQIEGQQLRDPQRQVGADNQGEDNLSSSYSSVIDSNEDQIHSDQLSLTKQKQAKQVALSQNNEQNKNKRKENEDMMEQEPIKNEDDISKQVTNMLQKQKVQLNLQMQQNLDNTKNGQTSAVKSQSCPTQSKKPTVDNHLEGAQRNTQVKSDSIENHIFQIKCQNCDKLNQILEKLQLNLKEKQEQLKNCTNQLTLLRSSCKQRQGQNYIILVQKEEEIRKLKQKNEVLAREKETETAKINQFIAESNENIKKNDKIIAEKDKIIAEKDQKYRLLQNENILFLSNLSIRDDKIKQLEKQIQNKAAQKLNQTNSNNENNKQLISNLRMALAKKVEQLLVSNSNSMKELKSDILLIHEDSMKKQTLPKNQVSSQRQQLQLSQKNRNKIQQESNVIAQETKNNLLLSIQQEIDQMRTSANTLAIDFQSSYKKIEEQYVQQKSQLNELNEQLQKQISNLMAQAQLKDESNFEKIKNLQSKHKEIQSQLRQQIQQLQKQIHKNQNQLFCLKEDLQTNRNNLNLIRKDAKLSIQFLQQSSKGLIQASENRLTDHFEKFNSYTFKLHKDKTNNLILLINELNKTFKYFEGASLKFEEENAKNKEKENQNYLQTLFPKENSTEVISLQKQVKQLQIERDDLIKASKDAVLRLLQQNEQTITDLHQFYTDLLKRREDNLLTTKAYYESQLTKVQERSSLKQELAEASITNLLSQMKTMQSSHKFTLEDREDRIHQLESELQSTKLQLEQAIKNIQTIETEKNSLQEKVESAIQKDAQQTQNLKRVITDIESKNNTQQLFKYITLQPNETLNQFIKVFYFRELKIESSLQQNLQKELHTILEGEEQRRKLWQTSEDNKTIKQLKEQLQSCKDKMDSLYQELAEYKTKAISKADSAHGQLLIKIMNLEQTVKNIDNEKQILSRQVNQRNITLQERNNQVNSLNDKIKNLENDKRAAATSSANSLTQRSQMDKLKREMKNLNDSITQKNEQIEFLRSSNQKIEKSNVEREKLLNENMQKMTNLRRENETLQLKNTNLQNEINLLSQKYKLQQAERPIKNVCQKCLTLQNEKIQIQQKLDFQAATNASLKSLLDNLQSQKDQLLKQNEEVKKKFNEIQRNSSSSSREGLRIREMETKYRNLEEEYNSQKSDIIKLQQSISSMRRQNEQLKAADKKESSSSGNNNTIEEQEEINFYEGQLKQLRYQLELSEKLVEDKNKIIRILKEDVEKYKLASRSTRNAASPPSTEPQRVNKVAKQFTMRGVQVIADGRVRFTSSACMTDESIQYKQLLAFKIVENSEMKILETKLIYRLGQTNQTFLNCVSKEELNKNSLVFLFRKNRYIFGVVLLEARIKGAPSAFLISLNNNKAIYRTTDKIVPVRFDLSNELTFGNGEIKYKHSSKNLMFCEIGNRYFEKFSRNDLLGEDCKTMSEVDDLEVHRLTLQ